MNFSLHDSGAFAILSALSGDGRLGGYAVNRLLISIIVLLGFCVANAVDLGYSPDGGLVSFGEFDYVYDSASRLTEVWSNGTRVAENQYDALGRRVIKRTPDATHTFVYDGWLLMVERVEHCGDGPRQTVVK